MSEPRNPDVRDGVERTLAIPANLPEDAVRVVRKFIDLLAEAESELGGVEDFGAFVLSRQQRLSVIGVMPQAMGDAVKAAILMAARIRAATAGEPCNCPDCSAARGDAKPDAGGLLARLFRKAPPPANEGEAS